MATRVTEYSPLFILRVLIVVILSNITVLLHIYKVMWYPETNVQEASDTNICTQLWKGHGRRS